MRISNRRASHDYQLFEKIEAGVVLTGGEVKSLLEGKASLEDAYVKIINGEAFLVNAHIHPYRFAKPQALDSRRNRKLLLHKKEILAIQNKLKQKNLTMVPLALYSKNRRVKLEFALAKGKMEYEKKEAIKRRDMERRIAQEIAEDLKN